MNQILVVEDNKDMADLVAMHLRDMGAEVTVCTHGDDGLNKALAGKFDLIILDIMLPGTDGLQICKQLRAQSNYTPVLMLTAKSTELDRVLGLEIGADDYLTKPFSIRELIARVKAILRRVDAFASNAESSGEKILRIGEMEIDYERRTVKLNGEELGLTAKEFDLLWYFASQPGRVFSRMQLLDQVWGYGHEGYEHTVNSHINRLRAKIEQDPSKPHYILTVWGVGYKFTDQEKQVAG